jgi:hypothetical protein
MGIFDSISAAVFNTSDIKKFIPSLIAPTTLIFAITLLLQSVSLLTVNIDYTILFNKLKFFMKNKLIRVKNKFGQDKTQDIENNETSTDIKQVEEKYKLSFVNAFVCSLFIFSLLFFLFILLFWIGTQIGNTII